MRRGDNIVNREEAIRSRIADALRDTARGKNALSLMTALTDRHLAVTLPLGIATTSDRWIEFRLPEIAVPDTETVAGQILCLIADSLEGLNPTTDEMLHLASRRIPALMLFASLMLPDKAYLLIAPAAPLQHAIGICTVTAHDAPNLLEPIPQELVDFICEDVPPSYLLINPTPTAATAANPAYTAVQRVKMQMQNFRPSGIKLLSSMRALPDTLRRCNASPALIASLLARIDATSNTG